MCRFMAAASLKTRQCDRLFNRRPRQSAELTVSRYYLQYYHELLSFPCRHARPRSLQLIFLSPHCR
jgi:hypothetical protein